jgi:hypothetical protein
VGVMDGLFRLLTAKSRRLMHRVSQSGEGLKSVDKNNLCKSVANSVRICG